MKTTEKTHSLLIPHLKHNAERSIIKYHIVELTLHLCIKSMVCWYMGHTGLRVPFWQRRTICRLWLPSGHENPCHNIHETCLWRQKWSNHDIRVESAYKSSILLIYLWSYDVWKKQMFYIVCFVFWHLLNELLLGKVRHCCTWRHLNYTWEFHNRGRERVHIVNSQTKHDQSVLSIATKVLLDSNRNEKFGRLRYVFNIFWW